MLEHPLALLNTSIITTDGEYTLTTVTLEEARMQVAAATSLDSAIGHQSTADIMTTLLGVQVETNRQQFVQQVGQAALVFKLRGRPEEGVVLTAEQIAGIGYDFKILVRVS